MCVVNQPQKYLHNHILEWSDMIAFVSSSFGLDNLFESFECSR